MIRLAIAALLSGLLLGCVTGSLPRPVVVHDEQGRILQRSQFNRAGRLLRETSYRYPYDSVSVKTDIVHHETGSRTETVIYHVWDTSISYQTITEFDTNGVKQTERTSLMPSSHYENRNLNILPAP